jgi:WD40 repeat protein
MTGHYTGNVTLWHASSGREIVSLPANVQGVMCAIASPDGRYWAIGGHDGVTYIWRALPWSLEAVPGDNGVSYADRILLYQVEQRTAWEDRLKKVQALLQKRRGILLE